MAKHEVIPTYSVTNHFTQKPLCIECFEMEATLGNFCNVCLDQLRQGANSHEEKRAYYFIGRGANSFDEALNMQKALLEDENLQNIIMEILSNNEWVTAPFIAAKICGVTGEQLEPILQELVEMKSIIQNDEGIKLYKRGEI